MKTCKKKRPTLLYFGILGVFILSSVSATAQIAEDFTGTVVNAQNQPLEGVAVQVQGSGTGAITGASGTFSIRAQKGKTLIFTMLGYNTHSEVLGNIKELTIQLSEAGAQDLDEVVVIGYGTVRKKDLTGSVAHIGQEVMETRVATSVTDFLKGSIAGVNIGVNNNASGGGSIQVRGPASLQASTSPLIVLDGNIYYGSMSDINPNDIESIDVLKDASSTAIYGSKGSAGVIMITTKKGKTEKPIITFNSKVGFANLLKIPDLPTPDQYVQRRADYWKTIDYFKPSNTQKGKGYYDNPDNLPQGITREQWAAYDNVFSGDYVETWLSRLQFAPVEIQNYKAGKTVDWRDQVYRTGLRIDNNISFSGRSPKTNYYTSFGYLKNEGFIKGDNFNTFRGRINLETNITDWLKIGTNTQFSNRADNDITVNVTDADVISPFGDLYNEDGTIKRFPTGDARIANPLLSASVDKYFYRVQTLNSTIFGKLTLPYGFSFQTNFNNRFGWRKDYYYHSDEKPGITKGGQASRNDYSDYEWIIDNILNWNYRIGKVHSLDATFVATAEKYQFWNSTGSNEGFIPNSNLIYHNLNAGINPVINSDDQMQTGNAILGRINYSLLNKYLFTASLRRDGFSAFGINNPYGVYPAFAFAWRISQEKFMENSAFNDLKLRLSWGESGNRDIGRYAALSKLNVTDNIIGGENVKGIWTDNLSNPNLKWERTRAANIGLDFALLNNRLSGIIDAYYNKTTDLILMRSLPTITGFRSIITNLGQVDNKGLEVTLSSINLNIPHKFFWKTSLIFSTNKNVIRHLYGEMVDVLDANGKVIGQREDDDVQNGWYIGHGINDIFDYKMIGIWQLGEEAIAKKYGKTPGDPRVFDANGDSVLNQLDKQWLGSSVPLFRASFRSDLTLWENIDFSFVLRGDFNYLAIDNMARNEDNRFFDRSNSIYTEYWMPEKPSNEYAKLGANTSNPNINIYKRRDYLRLQNASLSYRVPAVYLKRFSVQSLRLSANVDNAFVISNWTYFDPENRGRTPRIFTLGLDITL
ncbi:SusC/RagA family TonB-linked outer membrane protein [Haoranjiania flava]|uniref:SusC/RagA family TonB-linked outer membrane protein n=1 Tax=Haoranjiania flava TaxID=1856322 RepID=A0AAE3IKV8_9BACT|nr:SusC/RagA family TonB-linked outer membrane protein [Haoranjiania flava]MCU7693669.1 SusC/RagA family TonB-linked outer membrane protein [Haoranjiania flava]